ncbi:MAG: carbamoyl-phosphate synthase large subunit [Anaerolineae bacterium]|nr:carbamoyl-phosphate synthase large subunit [Anaerolineae bacterium]MDW8100382.1 carbamoyl-phosphate synthase large subunit [Anaerolineae bacterium]
MPKRTDIHSILVIGSGPIVIGQACEFDYSGTQAVKALKREGYRVILVNSNPATIMTDPELADATYVEPLTPEIVEKIIERERPDALLPTVGGQTGLNLGVMLAESGVLERYGVQLIGASLRAVKLAEDRLLFKEAMLNAGLEVPRSGLARSLEEAWAIAAEIGSYPLLIRPSFTLGGTGGGIAFGPDDFAEKVLFGLRESPVHSVLIEESVLGWKEFELEVMRDRNDNFVVVCSIENLDPMGVHTGDSITVAPAQTLTDKEYQRLRDQARAVMSAVGVETGGSNVQFAINPADGRILVIEMNPRVSRSSALASKATGFPIAKIAALLAVGYTLDEIKNDITRVTVAAFEPSIDYVVVKIPRWAFEKFPGVDPTLGPQMKSVGEVMAIGRTFKEALQKGLRSLEIGRRGFGGLSPHPQPSTSSLLQAWEGGEERAIERLRYLLSVPTRDRLFAVHDALAAGWPHEEICRLTGFDPWFVAQMAQLVEFERELSRYTLESIPAPVLRKAKRWGFSDEQIGELLRWEADPPSLHQRGLLVREKRKELGIKPTYLRVDTCAAEFEAFTPYLYSTYETQDEAAPTDRPKVMILGGGPNRIGQGIEFDYCCVHACWALRDLGYETIMVNCNPETVSTDYDTSDRLYFEPLTFEDVLNIVEMERPVGVIVQFGGQTPLNLVNRLHKAGVPIWGTSPDAIDLAEDRGRFGALLAELDIPQPANGTATSLAEAKRVARQIGYPVLVRPSYVLGGRAMAICYDEVALERYVTEAVAVSEGHPILIDQYVEDAYEVDVDAVCDGERVVIGGIMQHIEEAGVHSGDSACVLPPYKISYFHLNTIREYTERLGLALKVRGLMNVQFAIKDDIVYVLEMNPRASRTVPFVSKATGVPLARLAAQVMAGKTLAELGFTEEPRVDGFFVKEAVLPFKKLPGSDALLGPEMRSTGEVMGHASHFGHAFAKAEMGAGDSLPLQGTVLISVNDYDKGSALKIARDLHRLGFRILATRGTAAFLAGAGLPVKAVNKVSEGSPHVVDLIKRGEIHLIINTPLGRDAYDDGVQIRQAAVRHSIPLLTTLSAAAAAVQGIRALRERELRVRSLQEHHRLQSVPLRSS